MKRLTADRAEIGLQVDRRHDLLGVDLVEQRKRGDDDYSVDGEATTINGRTFQARCSSRCASATASRRCSR